MNAVVKQATVDAEKLSKVQTLASGGHSPGAAMCVMAEKLRANTRAIETGCHLYTGYCQPNGYGWVNVGKHKVAAHRLALTLAGVVIPSGMDVCHSCDVRNCVNPAHLYVGTRRQNMADCTERKRHNKPTGERHWCSKVTDSQASEIRALRAAGRGVSEIAAMFGIHHSHVSRIARGIYRSENRNVA